MKYLHTMIRVGNLDKSIQFYCDVLGFELLSREDFPNGEFTLAFLRSRSGISNEPTLELTYNWGVTSYEIGTGFGHLAYGVERMSEFKAEFESKGYIFDWGPSASPSGQSVIAFVRDPDGYKIEIIETRGR